MATLSVIVPMYNTEEYIEQCLRSLLNQSYQDIEVLVVDDGSTDGSCRICERIAGEDSRIRVIRQKNQGVIRARYAGVGASTGRYVVFADSDDFVNEDAYIYAKEAMDRDSDAILFEISRYNMEYQRTDKNPLPEGRYDRKRIEQEIYPRLIWDFEHSCYGMEMQLGVNIVKRDLILRQYDKIKDKTFWYGEDLAVIWPLYKAFTNIEIVDKCYYQHRQRTGCGSYIKNDAYLSGLYELYCYLLSEFSGEDDKYNWRKQIEYFYMHSVNLRKLAYGESVQTKQFLFPFDRVKKGCVAGLYGAGSVGRAYYEQLTQLDYVRRIIWVDRNHEALPAEVVSPKALLEKQTDVVVIAIEDKVLCESIKRNLCSMGIEADKIIF